MIRAIRPNAMAQDDAAMVTGWNISPNLAYVLRLNPGPYSCGVLLYSDDQTVLVASGAGLVGTDQPVVLHAYSGQSLGTVDADLGWHLLLTTTGTESQRTICIGPAVDLPDEIHPIYADDDLAVVRATAGVDDHAHYIDDISVTCPLGLGAGIGAVVNVPVDGAAVVGQVEGVTWTGTPNEASDAVVIRRHVAIAPEPWVDPVPVVPPTVADDAVETDAETGVSGNVLTNDESGLTIMAVNGLVVNVDEAVAGSSGGLFTITSTGAWTFDPDGDFSLLAGSDTADTSVIYHASDGVSEASGTLTVTVSAVVGAADPYWANTVLLVQPPIDAIDGSTAIVDAKGRALTRYGDTQIDTSLGYPTIFYDGSGDRLVAAASPDFNFGTGDFTVEAFINTTQSTGTHIAAIGINHNAMGYWGLRVRHGGLPKVGFTYNDGAAWRDLISNVSISDGFLHHIAVTRASLVFRIFVGGVLVLTNSSLTSAVGTSSYGLSLGYNQADNLYFAGHQAVARITKGAARYTAAFTPPAFPFPTV